MANMTVDEPTASAKNIDAALQAMGNRNEGEPVVNKLLSLFISLPRLRFMARQFARLNGRWAFPHRLMEEA